MADPAHKVTKAAVDYSKGHPNSRCGLCVHFRPPASCTEVRGDIDPAYWCRLFERRKEKADAQ